MEFINELTRNQIFAPNILVSGIHRSGSTWLGNMLALSWTASYIHEPFNINQSHKNSPIKNLYESADYYNIKENKDTYQYLKCILNSTENHYENNFPVKQIKQMLYPIYKRTIVKDPMALFSIKWLIDHFNIVPIIIIRHPAAVVASFKRKNWTFDFQNFLNQKDLIKNELYEFKDEMLFNTKKRTSLIEQGALLWKIIHYKILQYQKKYTNWYFVKHEDLSAKPHQEFQALFSYIKMYYSENIRQSIDFHTNNEVETDLTRNSLKNILSWKKILIQKEIETIKTITLNISNQFYNADEW